ncbi:hypothetical protein [uncultured Jannaschia sp.]|uniref:hypothetical protein n=1 Tax=uncultured Jannaschia sp. TaxID=293347 RepID=UPI00262AB2B3|nr:hypothetical protein [uncultured Jannaschia sp.]
MAFPAGIVRAAPDISLKEPAPEGAGRGAGGGAPVGRGTPRTFIAGLARDAGFAPRAIGDAMDRTAFGIHVETRLTPALSPGTVVIPDDISAGARKRPGSGTAREAGCRSGPFVPDPTPIETAFSGPKAHLRPIGARACDPRLQALGDICGLFDFGACRTAFSAAGYAPD